MFIVDCLNFCYCQMSGLPAKTKNQQESSSPCCCAALLYDIARDDIAVDKDPT